MFEEEIPPGLDAMAPGPVLAAFLSSINVATVSGYDRVVVLRAHHRMASHHQAEVYKAINAVADSVGDVEEDPQWVGEATAAEIRAALVLTRRAADTELGLALDLQRRLPQVAASLSAGQIDLRRARVIVDATGHLSVEEAREVAARVLGDAPGLTTGQLGARIRRLCLETDPGDAALRYETAVTQRRVVMQPTTEGAAHLMGLDLPPHRVATVTRRINRLARTLRRHGEYRTMDQLRADVLLDLLDGVASGTASTAAGETGPRPQGTVDLRVDLVTLAGLAEHPGELAGYGPVIADIARQVVADQRTAAEWRYTVDDPDTGRIVSEGTTRRRPTAGQRRHLTTRTTTCVFPGCRMPATDCDLDHRTPWAEGGLTTNGNLAPLCRHDHRIRHHTEWNYQSLPNGTHQWTTTLGHHYTTGRDTVTTAKPP
ncbi:MAG: DUF222 domain-containing protein [Acidimicrobiia bacterium]